MDNQIKSVCARQIFDSKCRPIIEVDVITEGGVLGRGSASTGTSVGMYEAVILVDGDPNRFGGKSVYHAIDNVNNIIGPAIIGMDVTDQAAIDRRMIELDGTPNKSELGGNAIYATSIACIKGRCPHAAHGALSLHRRRQHQDHPDPDVQQHQRRHVR